MMKVILDRYEEEYALCEMEDRSMLHLPKKHLPPAVQVGDVLEISIKICKDETLKRKQNIEKLADSLWED